ncbi:hypothetical protein GCM10020331_033110 [Ectobacillus funiculus]
MNFNLRGAVLANISGNSQAQLQDTIVDAIQSGEEKNAAWSGRVI